MKKLKLDVAAMVKLVTEALLSVMFCVTAFTGHGFGSFGLGLGLHDTRAAGNSWGTPVAKGGKGISRAHWRSFKLDLKWERDKH